MRDYDSLFQRLLLDLGFSETPECHVYSDMTVSQAAKMALANSFYKKLCPLGNQQIADRAALEKFERINASLPAGPVDFVVDNESESCFYDYFKNNLAVALQPECTGFTADIAQETGLLEIEETFNLDFIREHMMVGPGAAQKADSTSMVHKLFNGEMSYQNAYLIPLYRSAIAETGSWANAEKARFEKFGFTKVEGGKLFFASKNAEISRTCCTESNLEMLFQKAAGAFLELRLERHYGISLSRQPDFNRELARLGSIDGSFGTIDLVSASDSIGLQRLLQYFPTGFLKTILLASRSESAVLPDGRNVELRMISTMGNGFTFPLQTLIFASAVRACYQVMGFPCNDPRTEFGVFGDDIVVRNDTYEFVSRMLAKLGFEVNVRKSFNTGAFRESCGHDYVSGSNIRGVYCRSLETPQEVSSLINRLLRWGARHDCYLKHTLSELRSWIRLLRVPVCENDDSGVKVPAMFMPSTKVNDLYEFPYKSYVRRVKTIDMDPQQPEADKRQPFDEDGLAVGFLSGHLRRLDRPIISDKPLPYLGGWPVLVSIREPIGAVARYKIAHKSIPYWDYEPDPMMVHVLEGCTWRRVRDNASHVRWKRTWRPC